MTDDALAIPLALACGVEVRSDLYDPSLMPQLVDAAAFSDPLMLDVLDATLARGPGAAPGTLRTVLADAYSVWTRNGTPLATNNVRRQMRASFGAAGIEGGTPHAFRRTVATTLDWEVGIDPASAMLGHSSRSITEGH